VRRPSNYDGAAALLLGPVAPDPGLALGHLTMCKTVVEDSWGKVFVGGLPSDWSDEQVGRGAARRVAARRAIQAAHATRCDAVSFDRI
jgi:hypothetical protein